MGQSIQLIFWVESTSDLIAFVSSREVPFTNLLENDPAKRQTTLNEKQDTFDCKMFIRTTSLLKC